MTKSNLREQVMKIFVFTTLFFSLMAMSANSAEPEQYSIHCSSLSEVKSGTYNPIFRAFSDLAESFGGFSFVVDCDSLDSTTLMEVSDDPALFC